MVLLKISKCPQDPANLIPKPLTVFRAPPGTPASNVTAFLRNETAAPGLAKAHHLHEGNQIGSKATQNVDSLPLPKKNSKL